MQRFRAQSTRLMGDAKEQGDIEFGGEVLLESKVRSRMLLWAVKGNEQLEECTNLSNSLCLAACSQVDRNGSAESFSAHREDVIHLCTSGSRDVGICNLTLQLKSRTENPLSTG